MSNIGFPGLGLSFTINKTAFTVFGLRVQWYALIIVVGILAALVYFLRRGTRTEGFSEDDLLNICILVIPISIIGARTVYVLTSLEKYTNFWDAFKIWEGGLAIYGAILFGLATVLLYCRKRRLPALKLLDALAPAMMLGQVIGRWGNFVNAEAYGYSAGVEKLPWRMTVGTVYIDGVPHPEIEFVHPTFLYESLWNLLGFILINLFYRHKKRDGQVFYLYVAWYGLGRGLLEFLRTDSLRVFGFKAFVILGLGSFVAAVILLIVSYRRAAAEREELEAYASANAAKPAPETAPEPDGTLDAPVDYDREDDGDEDTEIDESEGEDNGNPT